MRSPSGPIRTLYRTNVLASQTPTKYLQHLHCIALAVGCHRRNSIHSILYRIIGEIGELFVNRTIHSVIRMNGSIRRPIHNYTAQ